MRDPGTVSTHSHPASEDGLTVGAVAGLVGVSVRTLHHWDEVGLVRPSGRTWADYRVYSRDDVARIHRVLVYREVGIPLARIGAILDDPEADEAAHLQRQRALLTERISRLQEMVSAVDAMMEADMSNTPLSAAEMGEIFGTDWNPDYQAEAQERWGDTEQWSQAQQRQAGMKREDWEQVKAETDALEADLADAAARRVEPGSDEANALAERHRASIDQWYDCTHSMHACLGRMYLADPRFTAHYDERRPGLAQWLHDAIAANARAHGVDPTTATWE